MPEPDYNYPECWAEYSLDAKNRKAEEIYSELTTPIEFTFRNILGRCQNDFKLASLVAYKIAVGFFKDNVSHRPVAEEFELIESSILPVHYGGGNMEFGRVFSINHCAFSSPDSIIGFRNSENDQPQRHFKVLKGLKFIGYHRNWTLFKLDKNSTDDMTGMLLSPLEKDFTIEFAHFPHNAERRFVYRWQDC